MRKMLYAAIALASLGLAPPAFAGDKETIQSLDDQFSAAANRGDADAVAAMYAFYSGLNAALWIIVVYRLPAVALPAMVVVQFFNAKVLIFISERMGREFRMA